MVRVFLLAHVLARYATFWNLKPLDAQLWNSILIYGQATLECDSMSSEKEITLERNHLPAVVDHDRRRVREARGPPHGNQIHRSVEKISKKHRSSVALCLHLPQLGHAVRGRLRKPSAVGQHSSFRLHAQKA